MSHRGPHGDAGRRCRWGVHSISLVSAISTILFIFMLYVVVPSFEHLLPRPLLNKDKMYYPHSFISARAESDLKHLVSIGPRVSGSYENEVLAVDFLKREVNFIIQQTHKNQNVQLDVQVVSGAYYADFKPFGMTSVYRNVQNVVVKLMGTSDLNSLMINCHFDSVPSSPGGSDDGLNCAVMLEVLRVLSRRSERLRSTVVFLFNGAEENPLHASHGFITQHKWADTIRAFLNLEAAGAGGRELLFQAGPEHPWLIRHYAAAAKHPFAQVCGEEIFQSGLIPSDTDFRIFRDFGEIPGIDMAHGSNGYVYHTKHDGFYNIPLGTYQHTGDNVLALTKSIANGPELSNTTAYANGNLVYFDIFGFMFVYSEGTGMVLSYCIIVLTVILTIVSSKSIRTGLLKHYNVELVSGFLISFLGLLLGLGISSLVAVLLDLCGRPLSWYSSTWLVPFLYWLPAILVQFLLNITADLYRERYSPLSVSLRVQQRCQGVSLFWATVILVMTCFGIRSTYIPSIVLLHSLISYVLIWMYDLQNTVGTWLRVHMICQLFPVLFSIYMTHITMLIFIPISGRSGSQRNPDLLISAMSVVFCFLTTSYLVPVVVLVKNKYYFIFGLFIVFLTALFATLFTSVGFPYRDDAKFPKLQRFYIHHTERISVNGSKDSGYFMLNMDRNAPNSVAHMVPSVLDAKKCPDEREMFCGLPVFSSRLLQISEKSTWIPASAPTIHQPMKFELLKKVQLENNITRYKFSLTGPAHMNILISPMSSQKLVSWSITANVPEPGAPWADRDTYFIKISYGLLPDSPYNFHIDLQDILQLQGNKVDIAVSGHFFDPAILTTSFQEFIHSFPTWANVVPSVASYRTFKF